MQSDGPTAECSIGNGDMNSQGNTEPLICLVPNLIPSGLYRINLLGPTSICLNYMFFPLQIIYNKLQG